VATLFHRTPHHPRRSGIITTQLDFKLLNRLNFVIDKRDREKQRFWHDGCV
jgi:hypothetical protein